MAHSSNHAAPHQAARHLALWLGLLGLALVAMGFAAGAEGWSWALRDDLQLIADIRAPRTLGAWLAGALLGVEIGRAHV